MHAGLQLVQGQAEIFGTELALGEELSLRAQKLAVRMSVSVLTPCINVSYSALVFDFGAWPPVMMILPVHDHGHATSRSTHGKGAHWNLQQRARPLMML